MLDPMADPGDSEDPGDMSRRRHAGRRYAERATGRGDPERKPREALAREPEPARGHVTESVTSGGGKDSTHILDR